MKKKYIIPQMEVISMNTINFLTASQENFTYGNQSDAPAMMNLPEENEQTEYEE